MPFMATEPGGKRSVSVRRMLAAPAVPAAPSHPARAAPHLPSRRARAFQGMPKQRLPEKVDAAVRVVERHQSR